jgi:hypothetical protein
MASDVQNWLNNPASNNGWVIKNQDETTATDFLAFWSWQGAANNNDPAIAPDLTVDYETPEPSGLLLMAVCIPLAMRRRRAARH